MNNASPLDTLEGLTGQICRY